MQAYTGPCEPPLSHKRSNVVTTRISTSDKIASAEYRASGKFKVVWRVESVGKEQAEELMRGMTRATGADVAATHSSRVLRVPGFWNHKYSAPHYVTVEKFEPTELRAVTGVGHVDFHDSPHSFPVALWQPSHRANSSRRKLPEPD
jgi:hypothetical protein